jgi:hypothetical protein
VSELGLLIERSIFFVQSKFQIIPEIYTISIIVEYYNIKCSSVCYHFDPITVYYKEKTISNPNSDTGMNYKYRCSMLEGSFPYQNQYSEKFQYFFQIFYDQKCSSVWYHFDPITVYYKEKTISNPNSDTGMNYVLVH